MTKDDLEAALQEEMKELKAIEESLVERAYSGRSLYKLVTADIDLLILLL
jgi:hypothetical protein